MPRIFSFNARSQGAKALSNSLGWPRIVHNQSEFRGNFKPWVLNWGSEEMLPHVRACKVINTPEAIVQVSDKLFFFMLMAHDADYMVPFALDRLTAEGWIRDGNTVVCRTLRRGHGGAGIVIADTLEQLVDAPLYTKYVKKQAEYRVHVFNDEVIDVQQKRRRVEIPDEDINWRVRNLAGGFIYARENVNEPAQVTDVAVRCMSRTYLDFGAVDVIWNEHEHRAYVLEINTAPGLEGLTLNNYVTAIRRFTDVESSD